MDKPWKVIFAFVGVFIAGAVFGGLFTLRASAKRFATDPVAMSPTPPPVATVQPAQVVTTQSGQPTTGQPAAPARNLITLSLMREFTKRLNLTVEQRKTINPIIARFGDDFQRLRKDNERQQQVYLDEAAKLSERMHGDVAANLSPEQRTELDTMQRQAQERAERERQKRAEAAAAAKAGRAPVRPNAFSEKVKTGGP